MDLYKVLTDGDTKALQPDSFNVQLKDHQLTMIHAMMELEKTGKLVYTENDSVYTLTTNFGILADMVGAGKTYETIGLICANPTIPNHEIIKESYYHCSKTYIKKTDRVLDTTLIIVPHVLVDQWVSVLEKTNLKT